jgi:hypothetical protein
LRKKEKTIKQNERKYIKELNTTTNRTRTKLLVLWLPSNRQWNTRTRGSIPKPKNQTDIFIPNNKIVWLVYTKIFIFFFPQQVWDFLEWGGSRRRTKKRSRRKKKNFVSMVYKEEFLFCFVLVTGGLKARLDRRLFDFLGR